MEFEQTQLKYDDIWNSNLLYSKRLGIMLGSQPIRFILSFLILNVSNITLLSLITNSMLLLWILLSVIILTNISLFQVLTRNPGIIPKNIVGFELKYELLQVPQITKYSSMQPNSDYMVWKDNLIHQIKYCAFCHIYRPPRSSHCYTCGNCILKYDHHCPWIGQCIGQNNYRQYIQLLIFGMFDQLCIFSICSITLNDEMIIKIILIIYTIPLFFFILSLQGLHSYLIITRQTSKEYFKQLWKTKAGNPFNQQFWTRHPEYVDFSTTYYRHKNFVSQLTQLDLSINNDKKPQTLKQPIQPYKEIELQIKN
ncbi:unnamed protein product [Paramecium octaurelia]|uniref:Palmitoyltransferase n=1 Tax=Paramecium octaurelia TaxID=43137 RepID=A0A8S1SFQ5_PAROT|nr:unnamed protein product [Paramecium octaurelia]